MYLFQYFVSCPIVFSIEPISSNGLWRTMSFRALSQRIFLRFACHFRLQRHREKNVRWCIRKSEKVRIRRRVRWWKGQTTRETGVRVPCETKFEFWAILTFVRKLTCVNLFEPKQGSFPKPNQVVFLAKHNQNNADCIHWYAKSYPSLFWQWQ